MQKRGQALIFLFIGLVAVAACLVYYFNYYQPSHPKNPSNSGNSSDSSNPQNSSSNSTIQNLTISDKYINVTQLHWNHMPLTYKILNESLCTGIPIDELNNAMKLIESSSNNTIKFVKNNISADITISCYDLDDVLNKSTVICKNFSVEWKKNAFNAKKENYIPNSSFVLSETQIVRNDTLTTYQACYVDSNLANGALDESKIITEGNIITNATMNIYVFGDDYTRCSDFPNKEVHQLLHTLGLDHSEEPRFHNVFGWGVINFRYEEDVMFQYFSCIHQKDIQLKYDECLQYIYTNGLQGQCAKVNFIK